ncbi:MAG: hypothetical protein B7Z68_00960 [Acidobacteria bacterium 21-70-11]|nr:MAG: hypothetical protein B7Z68_00960 [Acidobacteria bacterium 21-70-11]OYW05710.1 MAG: hypothetical protein B7Z61_05225 [Acidobacteria bacterium 37-71-11]
MRDIAVVLGVGPLLVISVFHTTFFYSANALTGSAWFPNVLPRCLHFVTASVALTGLFLMAHFRRSNPIARRWRRARPSSGKRP